MATTPRYRVVMDTSTRVSPDPKSPDFGSWLHYAAGDVVKAWPAHAPVARWVETGHWTPMKAKEAAE